MASLLSLLSLSVLSSATVLWDGRANNETSAAFLNNWSWSNQVPPYQYYIHGSGSLSEYVALDAAYKNPADASSSRGFQLTIDDTSYWNGQTMRRTELIPQTSAAINKGQVYYHFSIQHTDTNAPNPTQEHQITFFESHFTELKYGLIDGASGTQNTNLQWFANSQSQWSTNFTSGIWHNVAYAIDFSGNTVAFWHSTGSDPLTQVVAPVSVSASSNGADWHLGVLRLANSQNVQASGAEDWHFSGVYIETGTLTTNVSGPASS